MFRLLHPLQSIVTYSVGLMDDNFGPIPSGKKKIKTSVTSQILLQKRLNKSSLTCFCTVHLLEREGTRKERQKERGVGIICVKIYDDLELEA